MVYIYNRTIIVVVLSPNIFVYRVTDYYPVVKQARQKRKKRMTPKQLPTESDSDFADARPLGMAYCFVSSIACDFQLTF